MADFTVMVNASPAIAPVQNPDAHTCAVLDLPLRHISLLWSSYYSKFLAFGQHNGAWSFALSDDLITWGPTTNIPQESIPWNTRGNATITPISPMPGRWTFAPRGAKYVQDVPVWIGAVNASGQKMLSVKFKDGKEEGIATAWYENGQKRMEVNLKDGKEDGQATEWNEDGAISSEAFYKDGECISGDC